MGHFDKGQVFVDPQSTHSGLLWVQESDFETQTDTVSRLTSNQTHFLCRVLFLARKEPSVNVWQGA